MAPVDRLPADQRAVLSLVLQRGRGYDEIARLLSITRAAVRTRALAALDAVAPVSDLAPERRALITDYLLGQLPRPVAEETRIRLARYPAERAWARLVAAELGGLATHRLPEIPSESVGDPGDAGAGESAVSQPAVRRSSRVGGAVLIGVAIAATIAVVVIAARTAGNKKKATAANAAAASTAPTPGSTASAPSSTAPTPSSTAPPPSSTAPTGTTGAATTASTPARIVGQVALTSPRPAGQTAGIAEVVRQGSLQAVFIDARNVPANSNRDAYAVWLYNSASDSQLLGFVNPGVSASERLATRGRLPTNVSHYKQLIITDETRANPRQPGTIVLQGPLKIS